MFSAQQTPKSVQTHCRPWSHPTASDQADSPRPCLEGKEGSLLPSHRPEANVEAKLIGYMGWGHSWWKRRWGLSTFSHSKAPSLTLCPPSSFAEPLLYTLQKPPAFPRAQAVQPLYLELPLDGVCPRSSLCPAELP